MAIHHFDKTAGSSLDHQMPRGSLLSGDSFDLCFVRALGQILSAKRIFKQSTSIIRINILSSILGGLAASDLSSSRYAWGNSSSRDPLKMGLWLYFDLHGVKSQFEFVSADLGLFCGTWEPPSSKVAQNSGVLKGSVSHQKHHVVVRDAPHNHRWHLRI